eukprot:5774846-Pleurochrysis_carterae.AAC.1
MTHTSKPAPLLRLITNPIPTRPALVSGKHKASESTQHGSACTNDDSSSSQAQRARAELVQA